MSKTKTLKQDFIASSVVFLVAIPLCLGIALASNAPLFSGILSGVIGGIVVGFLSRSHVSVSGPAAGLVAVVLAAIHELGSFESFLLALTLGGILQIIIGKLKAGFIADYVPTNVIQGLLCAIGIMIIIKQLPFAIGFFDKTPSVMNELRESQETLDIQALMNLYNNISFGAVIICFSSLALLFSWAKVKSSKLKMIPGPVIVVILGIVANLVFKEFVPLLHLDSRDYLVTIPAIERLFDVRHLFSYQDLSQLYNIKVYFYAGLIAVIATIETLLNLEAAEKIDTQKRYCDRNKEMVAQGIGNTIAGLLGGLPITSVIVRSSVSVQSGSKTKLASIMHGCWLMLSVLLIPKLINMIPLASLAAILIYVGFKLANHNIFREMYQRGLENFIPFIVTVVMIVATDLLIGVVCGLIVSAILVMKYNSEPEFAKELEVYPNGDVLRILLPQQATFLNKAALIETFRSLPEDSKVILDASHSHYIDYDIKEVIEDFSINLSKEKNISLRTKGFKEHYDHVHREDFTTVTTAYVQESLSPKDVLNLLEEGNKRFVDNSLLNRDLSMHIAHTADTQHPIAAVLGCVDSRVPIEMVFDVGVGDLFVNRVIGNVVNDDVIAGLEFACAVAGAKLIVVMGHTRCGAIKAACGNHHQDKLAKVTNKIKKAIDNVNDRDSSLINDKDLYLDEITSENVKLSTLQIMSASTTLTSLISAGTINIIGAMYDVKTGLVTFNKVAQEDISTITLKAQKIQTKAVNEKVSMAE